jgi:thimet oligopeptidase
MISQRTIATIPPAAGRGLFTALLYCFSVLPLEAQDTGGNSSRLAWRLTPAELAGSCRSTINNARTAIDAAARSPTGSAFQQTLQPIEAAIGEFISTTAPKIILYLISPDPALRDSSQACDQAVTNFGVEIAADPRIFAAAQRAQHEELSTSADSQLVRRYIEAGRRSGAGLDSAQRGRATALFKHLYDLQRDFSIALAQDSTSITIEAGDTSGLPAQLRASLRGTGQKFIVPVDESTREEFLSFERNPETRRRYQLAYDNRGGTANVDRLRRVLAVRDTLADLLGFQSWAAYQLDTRMARTPDRVMKFLNEITAQVRPKAEAELARLAPLAKRDRRPVPVIYSDYYYYAEQLRKDRYALDSDSIRAYFPVDHVIQSVIGLYQELLGLKLSEEKSPDVWAAGVRGFVVHEGTTGKPLGQLYLDLFPRPNKFQHFADFPVRPARDLPDGSRQLARTAIIGNWPKAAPGKPALLSHSDVITFFHEFGHAMSALLDRSPYVTTGSGNLRQDFVEAPSQMLENWMWQPSILRRVSRHVKSGSPLPDRLINRMLALKHLDDGWLWARQAFYATYDMRLHTSPPDVDPTALFFQLFQEITPVSQPDSTVPEASFGHLMGYDAGYYGYLWAKVYAQDMFSRFEREGLLSRSVGRAYRDEVLAPGATVEPDQLVRRFLGRPVSYEAFYRELGLDAPSALRRQSQ